MEEWGSPLEALAGQREELRAQIRELRALTREQQRLATQLHSQGQLLGQAQGQGQWGYSPWGQSQELLGRGGREHGSSLAQPPAYQGTERWVRGRDASPGPSPGAPPGVYQV